MNILLIILLALALVQQASTAYCHGKPGNYNVNNEPIWQEEPRLLKKHAYGQLY